MNNLVSIITPAYNAEKYISYTIESVISQTYKNWEMIIVDDCSVDRTKNIIKEYSARDNRIKYIFLDENKGVSNARNTAISHARGRYIAFLDSDDLWYPDKLTIQISYMEENNYYFTFTNYEFIDHNGNKLNKVIKVPKKLNYKDALYSNSIPCLTVVLNKEVIKEIRMPNIKHEDYATWLNILKNNIKAYGINTNLAMYRKLNNSLSSNKFKSMLWTWNIYRDNQKIGLINSMKYISSYIFKNIIKHM